MGRLRFDISVSLDGFVAGPRDDVSQLHRWLNEASTFREWIGEGGGESGPDADVFAEMFRGVGAILVGRRMFDVSEEPWGEDPPFHLPIVVVTHRARETVEKKGGTTYTFVTDGLAEALRQAKAAAGDQDVLVAGGANIAQQCIKAGLLDEMEIHVVPVLLCRGRRLWDHLGTEPIDLTKTRAVDSAGVTHLRYRFA